MLSKTSFVKRGVSGGRVCRRGFYLLDCVCVVFCCFDEAEEGRRRGRGEREAKGEEEKGKGGGGDGRRSRGLDISIL